MRLTITSKKKLMSQAFSDHISHRFLAALDRFANYIANVRVRFEDLNGPRGGIDKRCYAVVSLVPGGSVTIEATASDAYDAVDRAAQRAKITLARQVDRHKQRRVN